jgi:hypothetical protein
MKKKISSISLIILILLFLSIRMNSSAQVPGSFNYQAIPRNPAGGLYLSQTMNCQATITAGSANGPSVYVETFNTRTDNSGVLNLQIGKGIPVSGVFSAINWEANSYFLKIEIDPDGGYNFIEVANTQIISVQKQPTQIIKYLPPPVTHEQLQKSYTNARVKMSCGKALLIIAPPLIIAGYLVLKESATSSSGGILTGFGLTGLGVASIAVGIPLSITASHQKRMIEFEMVKFKGSASATGLGIRIRF